MDGIIYISESFREKDAIVARLIGESYGYPSSSEECNIYSSDHSHDDRLKERAPLSSDIEELMRHSEERYIVELGPEDDIPGILNGRYRYNISDSTWIRFV